MIIKILGAIDLVSSITLILLALGFKWLPLIMFCAGFLLLKGMFIFTGDFLSVIDIVAFLILILSLLFVFPSAVLWFFALLLAIKSIWSFV